MCEHSLRCHGGCACRTTRVPAPSPPIFGDAMLAGAPELHATKGNSEFSLPLQRTLHHITMACAAGEEAGGTFCRASGPPSPRLPPRQLTSEQVSPRGCSGRGQIFRQISES